MTLDTEIIRDKIEVIMFTEIKDQFEYKQRKGNYKKMNKMTKLKKE